MLDRQNCTLINTITQTRMTPNYPKTVLLEDSEGCFIEPFTLYNVQEETMLMRLEDTDLISAYYNYEIWADNKRGCVVYHTKCGCVEISRIAEKL